MAQTITKKELNRKTVVAGFFFVFMQLLVRGVTFLITPFYTRLVSVSQYGEIRVYAVDVGSDTVSGALY